MPQISLYIDEETLKKVEKTAKKEHVSISKWVGNNIKRSFSKDYPLMVAEEPAVYNAGVRESDHGLLINIEEVGERLLESLKNAAKIDNTSVNNEIIMIIESYFSKRKTVENNTSEWLKLAGSWEDGRPAEEIIDDIKSSRTENKRFEDGLLD
ncbi:MAG TPA: hypothetical protein PKW56_09265 [Clostridiales bacterium]|nr:hypothetical protein [Clostridiales bacterium]